MPNNYVEEQVKEFEKAKWNRVINGQERPSFEWIHDFLRSSLTSAIIHGIELAEGSVPKEEPIGWPQCRGLGCHQDQYTERALARNQFREETLTSINKIKESLR